LGSLLQPLALTLSATGAQAEEWCGYTTQPNAVIECGYTTASDCTTAVGKGGMCFVDPELARYFRRIEPPHGCWPQGLPNGTDDR
jgi:hypothetical protein